MKTNTGNLVLALLALVTMGGCGTLTPQPDSTRYFSLSAPESEAITSTNPETQVNIRVFRISDYLESPRMVVRVSENELRYSNLNRWADPVEDSFGRVIADSLRADLSNKVNVVVVPLRHISPFIVTVDLGLIAFEGDSDGRAVIEAEWRVWSGHNDTPSSSGYFRKTAGDWDDSDYGQLARILSELTQQMAATLAESVQAGIRELETQTDRSEDD